MNCEWAINTCLETQDDDWQTITQKVDLNRWLVNKNDNALPPKVDVSKQYVYKSKRGNWMMWIEEGIKIEDVWGWKSTVDQTI